MSIDTYAKAIGFQTMNHDDYEHLKRSTKAVYDLMRDGEWHRAQEIIDASGTREGLRRMRELREHHRIESKRLSQDNRDWAYRIIPHVLAQAELPI